MTYTTFKTNFERELLFQLIYNLKNGKTTKVKGKVEARILLEALKYETTIEGLIERMSKNAFYYPEIREAFLKTVASYEKEIVEEKLLKVREALIH